MQSTLAKSRHNNLGLTWSYRGFAGRGVNFLRAIFLFYACEVIKFWKIRRSVVSKSACHIKYFDPESYQLYRFLCTFIFNPFPCLSSDTSFPWIARSALFSVVIVSTPNAALRAFWWRHTDMSCESHQRQHNWNVQFEKDFWPRVSCMCDNIAA